jgi:hypothetical protein
VSRKIKSGLGRDVDLSLESKGGFQPNVPRPPNLIDISSSKDVPTMSAGNGGLENEEFLDANDQGVPGSSDSEMEEVREKPDLSH